MRYALIHIFLWRCSTVDAVRRSVQTHFDIRDTKSIFNQPELDCLNLTDHVLDQDSMSQPLLDLLQRGQVRRWRFFLCCYARAYIYTYIYRARFPDLHTITFS